MENKRAYNRFKWTGRCTYITFGSVWSNIRSDLSRIDLVKSAFEKTHTGTGNSRRRSRVLSNRTGDVSVCLAIQFQRGCHDRTYRVNNVCSRHYHNTCDTCSIELHQTVKKTVHFA